MPRTQIQRKRLSLEWCLRMIFHIDNDNEDPLTGLRTDGAVWKSLSRQLLAHSHQADPVHLEHHDDDEEKPGWQSLQCQWLHLNDMIIDSDASVTASDGVFDNSLNLYYYFIYIIIIIIYKHKHICDTYFNINVQLVGDSVDHVDPDDPDAKAGRRTQTGFHHEVNLHLIIFVIHTSDLVYSNFCIIWHYFGSVMLFMLCPALYIIYMIGMKMAPVNISYQVHFVNLLFQLVLEPAIGDVEKCFLWHRRDIQLRKMRGVENLPTLHERGGCEGWHCCDRNHQKSGWSPPENDHCYPDDKHADKEAVSKGWRQWWPEVGTCRRWALMVAWRGFHTQWRGLWSGAARLRPAQCPRPVARKHFDLNAIVVDGEIDLVEDIEEPLPEGVV